MSPGALHFVLTTEDTVTIGNHFYLSRAAAPTAQSLVHTLLLDNLITNTTHADLIIYRLEMIDYFLNDFPWQLCGKLLK